jgi:hypothetical protein
MNDQTEKVPSQPDTKTAADGQGNHADPTYNEAPEIRGWALQWDTTELRKTNLARKMRHLRQSSPDQ